MKIYSTKRRRPEGKYDAGMVSIQSSEEDSLKEPKTKFYSVTENDLKDILVEGEDSNVFLYGAISTLGFDCLNLDSMYGSGIVNSVLYLCDTNGKDIIVNGEDVAPGEALSECSIEDLSEYIYTGEDNPEIIRKELTAYELKTLSTSQVNNIVKELITTENFKFLDILESYQEYESVHDWAYKKK